MNDSLKTLPLEGIRVLDLSRVLAGPLCTMMLGDLGADILKVERPGAGDDTRGWGPPFADDGESAYFRSVNRNKLSVALDLDAPADAARLRELLQGADVVVENYLPGALARRGFDAARLLAEHPRLVWCTISGFGADSPRPGYDFVVQAEAGWMAITGPADGPPSKVGVALADVIAGKDAAAAILAALVGRDRLPGLPASARRVRIALHASATAALVNVAQNTLVSGQAPARWGNAHPNLVPYQLFDARDRALALAVGNDAQWAACAGALDLRDEAVHGAWRTNAGRVADRERLVARLAEILRERDAAEWMDRLSAAGVPNGLVKSVPEALAEVWADAVSGVAPATGGAIRRPPPRLDEHGDLVRRIGWDAFTVTVPARDPMPGIT